MVDLIDGLGGSVWPTGAVSKIPEGGFGEMLGMFASGLFDSVGKQVHLKCKYCDGTNILEI